MFMRIITLTLMLVRVALSSAGGPSMRHQLKSEVLQVSYREVFSNKAFYQGKLIRLKLTWRFGHSFSFVYDPACRECPSSWITFAIADDLCEGTQEKLKGLNKEFLNETELTAVGWIYRCEGGCGHSSSYEYRFVVACLEEAKPLKVNEP